MAQLSQFDKVATIKDGKVTVSGPVAPERDEDGREVARRTPVHFHFLILKDGHVLRGHSASIADQWSGETEPAVHGLTEGPALALAVSVEPRAGAAPTFETASWAEEIEVRFQFPDDPQL